MGAGVSLCPATDISARGCSLLFQRLFYLKSPALPAQGPVLATAELAADEALALEARAEARDYVDFQALAKRFTIEELREATARTRLSCLVQRGS